MSTIATTTNTTPFQFPGNRLMAHPNGQSGYLMCMVKATTADNYVLYRSTDRGVTWGVWKTIVRTNLVDIGSIFCDNYGWLFWAYRTNESSQDRIYCRRLAVSVAGNIQDTGEVLIGSSGNGAVAGAVYSGLDLVSHYHTTGWHHIAVAVGTRIGATSGVTLMAGTIDPNGVLYNGNYRLSGTVRWMYTDTSGRVGPSIDKEHTGDGYASTSPNLWVTFGRTAQRLVKVPWSGDGWTGSPGSTVMIPTFATATNTSAARWDGTRHLTVMADPNNTSQVLLLERNRSNSTTTTRRTAIHTTGVIRAATMAYNTGTLDVRVYAVGTSTGVLYYTDYVRATGLWTAWAATALTILGAAVDNFGVRSSSWELSAYALYSATSGSPNTLTLTPQTLSYAPNTPTWVSPPGGAAQDVGSPLILTWAFTDYDTTDVQSAYAVSKQVGAGALSYWRASDSTWQVAEVQNTAITTALTIPAAWGAASDAATTFKVKVWDTSGPTASAYSAGLVVIPSTTVNPLITAPTPMQVTSSDHVTLSWTAAEQVQYDVTLNTGTAVDLFGRTLSASWGSADTAQAWTLNGTAADFTVGSGLGKITATTTNSDRSAVMTDGLDGNLRTVTVDVSYPALPASGVIRAGVHPRYVDSANYYNVVFDISTAGLVTLRITKRLVGVTTTLATFVHGTAYVGGTVWHVEARTTGSTILGKCWTGTAEPEYQLTATDTAFPLGLLTGVFARNETAVTTHVASFDSFAVTNAAAYLYDSGWVSDPITQSVVVPYVLANNSFWVVHVRTTNLEGLSSTDVAQPFSVVYVNPMTPTTVTTPSTANGWNAVAITNPAPAGGAPAVAYQDLYRRIVGQTATVKIAGNLANNATYNDWQALHGVAYEYQAFVVGVNGTSTSGVMTA